MGKDGFHHLYKNEIMLEFSRGANRNVDTLDLNIFQGTTPLKKVGTIQKMVQ